MGEKIRLFSKSMVFRILLGIFAVFLPLNIIMIIVGRYVYNQAFDSILRENYRLAESYVAQMDYSIKLADSRLMNVVHNNVDYLRLTKAAEDSANKTEDEMSAVRLRNSFEDISDSMNELLGIFAIFPERNLSLIYSKYQAADDVAYFLRGLDAEGLAELADTWRVRYFSDTPYILVTRYASGAYYGFWLNPMSMLQKWTATTTADKRYVFYDHEERMVTENYKLGELLKQQENKVYSIADGSIVMCVPSENKLFYLVEYSSKSLYQTGLSFMVSYLIVLVVLCVIAMPVLIIYFSRHIIRPVGNLTKAMHKINIGDMDYRIEQQRESTEFELLNQNFNEMMDNIQQLRFDVYDGEIQRQKVRLRYLSQQIQPHFMLNALTLINSYEPDEYELIQRLVLCLVKYFRYIVNVNEDFVELGSELEHIRNYLEIQQARYPDGFSAKVEDCGFGNVLIPPLSVHTFVENTIKHALRSNQKISINVYARMAADNRVVIIIEDTGPGFSPQVVEQFKQLKKQPGKYPALGTGIKNTVERFRLLYPDVSEITLENKGGGAAVSIYVPEKYVSREG